MDGLPLEVTVDLILITVCVLLSAFFSIAETSITALGPLKTKHLIELSEKNTHHLGFWLKKPSHVLTTILIFNNVVCILTSALTTVLAMRYFGGNFAVGIATGITTFLILLFGEVIPKSIAKANAEILAGPCLKMVVVLYRLIYPLVLLFAGVAAAVIRVFGGDPNAAHPTITEDELEFIVDESEAAGVIEKTKKDMISGVFEFDETIVREIMTPRTDITVIRKDDSVEKAIKVAVETGHSRIPVYEDRIDNIVGILIAKDLLKYVANIEDGAATVKIADLMRKPFFVPESKPIMHVFKDLKRNKNHMAIVIDEHGGTAGIVTMEDILEEIVGEIQDEFDTEEAKITKVSEGVYDVAGSANIGKFLEYFDMDESMLGDLEQEVDTMGGLLTHMLGDMPKVGQGASLGPFNFKVTETVRHRIKRLRVTLNLAASLDRQAAP